MITKPLTEETFLDAQSVIMARFPKAALAVLEKTMANPLRAECSEIGDIAYEDSGRPVGFRAANRRRMHFFQEPILGRVRGLTCRLADSSKEVMPALCQAQMTNLRGCQIAFSNTQSIPTAKRAAKMGASAGPVSCTRMLCRIINPLRYCAYFLVERMLKMDILKISCLKSIALKQYERRDGEYTIRRELKVRADFFDCLMENYLKTNEGLVSDRDSTSISWLFGTEIENSNVILLTAQVKRQGVGYIALKTDDLARHWLIIDLFALKNDQIILEILLRSAIDFLTGCPSALIIKTIGFPDFIQPLLKKYLPHVRNTGVNWFSYNFLNQELALKFKNTESMNRSWFFGPFDGDLCM